MNEPLRHAHDEDEGPTPQEIKYLLQQSLLRHYPNPERKDCLDSETLTLIAEQKFPHQDSHWDHVSHCSPCYREFLDHRTEFKTALKRTLFRRRLLVWIGIGAIAALTLSAVVTLIKNN